MVKSKINLLNTAPTTKTPSADNKREGEGKAIISATEDKGTEKDLDISKIIQYTRQIQKPEDYGIIVRDISTGLFGKSLISEKELENMRLIARRSGINKLDNKDIIIQKDAVTGEIYNNLSVFDKKFIIALQVLLSDQTKKRHEILESSRKPKKKKEYTLEIPDIFTGVDKNGIPPVLAEDMSKDGFNLSEKGDTIVIIPGKAFFLKKYLGYSTIGGKDYDSFDKAIHKLRTGLFAITGDMKGASAKFSKVQSLIKQITIYNYKAAGGTDLNIYVISLLPILTEGIGNNYKLIPPNNAEIFNAIGENEALFNLYDYLLLKLTHNEEKIANRGAVKQIEVKEEELLNLIAKDKEDLRKHRTRLIDTLYKGLKMFYELKLLAKEVKPLTPEARSEAKAKKDTIVLSICIKRIADGQPR